VLITPTIVNDYGDAKILPSNATDKSTDTEGVELSVYPADSGSFDSPPKVKDVLTGGKRKGGSKASRCKKKSKKRNDNCRGGASFSQDNDDGPL